MVPVSNWKVAKWAACTARKIKPKHEQTSKLIKDKTGKWLIKGHQIR